MGDTLVVFCPVLGCNLVSPSSKLLPEVFPALAVHNEHSFLMCCWDLLVFLCFHHHIFPLALLILTLFKLPISVQCWESWLVCTSVHVDLLSTCVSAFIICPRGQSTLINRECCVFICICVCAYTWRGSVTEWLLAALRPALLNLNEYFDSGDSLTDWTWLGFQTCANVTV